MFKTKKLNNYKNNENYKNNAFNKRVMTHECMNGSVAHECMSGSVHPFATIGCFAHTGDLVLVVLHIELVVVRQLRVQTESYTYSKTDNGVECWTHLFAPLNATVGYNKYFVFSIDLNTFCHTVWITRVVHITGQTTR